MVVFCSIHVLLNFSFLNSWIIIHGVNYHIFIIHSLIDGHLGCFYSLAVMNRAAMHIDKQISLKKDMRSLGYQWWLDNVVDQFAIL